MRVLAYTRAGDACVELVTVTPETVDGHLMPVVRVISRSPEQALKLGYALIGEALRMQEEKERPVIGDAA